MHTQPTYDSATCQLPFTIGADLALQRERVTQLRALHIAAGKVAEEMGMFASNAEFTAQAMTGYDVQSQFWKPIRKLVAADKQARATTTRGFLTEQEQDEMLSEMSTTEAQIAIWQTSPEILAFHRIILTKYADAIAAEVKDVTPRHHRDQHGHADDPVYDYTDVIDAGIQANQ